MSRKIEGYIDNYEEELNEVEKQLGRSLTKEEEQIVGEMVNTNYELDEVVEVISRGITINEYGNEVWERGNKMVAIVKENNLENDGEVVADVAYSVWVGDKELAVLEEFYLGVKLNKEQADDAQKNNLSDKRRGEEELLTEGYYITMMGRGGEHYYKMDSEADVIMGLLKLYEEEYN